MKIRNDKTVPEDGFSNVSDYYSTIRAGIREKANHNKWESQFCFYFIIFATLLSPLFITLGEGWFFGKVVPACLSVAAAATTAWMQSRKPQRLWQIYRRAQRELEREKIDYDFRLADFENANDPDKLLACKVSKVCIDLHYQWEGLIPQPDAIIANLTGSSSEKVEADDATKS